MPTPFGAFAIVFVTAFVLSVLLTPLAARFGIRHQIVALPDHRRKHKGVVPRTGGLAVYLAFVGAVLIAQLFVTGPDVTANLPALFVVVRHDPEEILRLIGMFLSCTVIIVVGLYDDWKEMPPTPLYLAQLVAGGIAIAFLIIIEYVNNPFTGRQTADFPYILTVIVTLFWLGLVTNTVNWLDGLDGLAAGIAAIASLILFFNGVFRLDPPQHSVALISLALLGASLGFLPYNFAPARIFLGSGAYFLGFTLGIMSIIGGAKAASILMVLGLPLLDTAWQIVNRLARGVSPAQGDRGHLHFRLLDFGLSQRLIVLGYYLFCALFGGLSLLIPSRIYKFMALVVMAILALLGFLWLSRQAPVAIPEGET